MPHVRRHGVGKLLRALDRRRNEIRWRRLPERLVFVRHGESRANVDTRILAEHPDHLVDLSPTGVEQARAAGVRIAKLAGDQPVLMVLSPFERARQTALQIHAQIGTATADRGSVVCIHTDPRIREQEFGNFQDPSGVLTASAEAERYGRFYYRRDNGESSADVYDRVSDFLSDLLDNSDGFPLGWSGRRVRTVVVVTHGLTMRMVLMRHFRWSVDTFAAVYNPVNCEQWVLNKDVKNRKYTFSVDDSFPGGRLPWACAQVVVHTRDGESLPYTVVDYLALPQSRAHLEITGGADDALAILRSAVPGHRDLNPTRIDVAAVLREAEEAAASAPAVAARTIRIDWNPRLSEEAAELRHSVLMNVRRRRRVDRSSLALGPSMYSRGLQPYEGDPFTEMDSGR